MVLEISIEEMYIYKSLMLCFTSNKKMSPPPFHEIVNHNAIRKKSLDQVVNVMWKKACVTVT